MTVNPASTSNFRIKRQSIGAGRHARANTLHEAAEIVGQAM